MKKKNSKFLTFAFMALVCSVATFAQDSDVNYKHPFLNSSGEVLNEKGAILGTVTKDGVVKNAAGEIVGYIKGTDLTEPNGKKIGSVGKNGTFYDDRGAVVFTINKKSKGERCKIYDPNGKIIAEVHESYKNQACAIHCLYNMKEMKH